MDSIFGETKGMYGYKNQQKSFGNIDNTLTKYIRYCRLLRVDSIVSGEFWRGAFYLQFADVLEGM